MASAAATARAKEYLAQLERNVDDWYADAISYEEFSRRNRATWDSIPAELNGLVARLVCPLPAPTRSATVPARSGSAATTADSPKVSPRHAAERESAPTSTGAFRVGPRSARRATPQRARS